MCIQPGSPWPKTDPFLKTVIEDFQIMAKALDSVPEMVILGIFPWCFTPELYAAKPDHMVWARLQERWCQQKGPRSIQHLMQDGTGHISALL